ncbi:MAG: BrxA/BrxB family bacilliredoxin [Microscillaceae bacterium]|jgi:putative YphP/YqiW family bacilliredoxin|nr:BrxA/BrxB family bacilliredoxin [Microscillaceae bacterium]
MYPEHLVAPMIQDLTNVGFEELKSSEAVDNFMQNNQGTTLVMINSVCGCAAGAARPGVKLALASSAKKPAQLVTVFAGVDKDAVAKTREYLLPYPPSSPSIALFKDGELVHFLERHHIEGRSAAMIADNLMAAFADYCN